MKSQIYNGLVRFRPGSADLTHFLPDLAEEWGVSPDGLTWTFKLRRGVQFHHGYGEFSAEDVKFVLDRLKGPESKLAAGYAHVREVRSKGPHEVTIHLSRPDPLFLLLVANYQGGWMVSKRAVEERGKDFTFKPVGTGAFAFTEYVAGQKVVLARNEKYFRGAPAVAGIEFRIISDQGAAERAFMAGELQVVTGLSEQQWIDRFQSRGDRVWALAPGVHVILYFNMNHEPLKDRRVRQAIAHAINRKEIVDTLYGAAAQVIDASIVPPAYFGHITQGVARYEYNPDKARQLLREAGRTDLRLRMIQSNLKVQLDHVLLIQEQLRRVGIGLQVEPVEHPVYHERIRKDLNDLIAYSTLRAPDGALLLRWQIHSTSAPPPTGQMKGMNFGHYTGSDELIEKAEKGRSLDERRRYVEEVQRAVARDVAAVPLYIWKYVFATSPKLDLGYDAKESLTFYLPVFETARFVK
ncbi:MAG: polyamine ABC transporter substrate-binding protein [Candidatus Rokubacteria bacterium]|nr:polyamine ABC transporter substrate-binding protein [Candidatus Rokubacteria bacterium]